jgi:predicted nucleotidyltransferase component of viral defense system
MNKAIYTDTQLREIFHFLFLERLLKIADPGLFVLKGGVNLRFYFGSPRYSEDMDLDVLGGAVATLKKNGYKILNDAAFLRVMASFGIADIEVNDPNKAKHTETTQRFRVSLVNLAGRRLPTKVEFSRRGLNDEPFEFEEINPEIARTYRKLSYKAQHYTGEAAVLQKIRALAGRPATQARDVFDLEILRRAGYAKRDCLMSSLSNSLREKATEATMSLTFSEYQGQVVDFLETEDRSLYGNESEWLQMQENVMSLLTEGL